MNNDKNDNNTNTNSSNITDKYNNTYCDDTNFSNTNSNNTHNHTNIMSGCAPLLPPPRLRDLDGLARTGPQRDG